MKKIYASLILAMTASVAIAQGPLTTHNNGPLFKTTRVPKNVPQRAAHNNGGNSTQSSQTFFVDYDYMDESYNLDTIGYAYQRFIWDMNMNYDLAAGDTSLQYAIVDFSALYDSYNQSSFNPVPWTSFSSYTIDSVYVLGGHENNSGNNDTIQCKIIALNSAGYPQTTVLNTTEIVTNTSLSTPDWLNSAIFGFAPNYTVNNNTSKFGVQIEYYGATADSFGILAGFGDLQTTCPQNSSLPYFALTSHYANNSYRYDMRFNPYVPTMTMYGIFPTSTNIDTYYECNGTSNAQIDGTATGDSENYLQNWGIWVKMTVNGVGFNELAGEEVKVNQNVPNPTNGITKIDYALKNNGKVTFSVYDIAGKLVYSNNEGNQAAGVHTIELNTNDYNAGVYFYTVNVDGVSVTKKMTVTK
ncbi:MAG: hypothetical protein FD123_2000 [Bacteroidetes bacterium]|nr:MAG: hypothetical protein FD123_2000 [Bacteroidota bacterium]